MAFLISYLSPSNWMSSPNAVFAQNVSNDIAQFEQQLTTTYKATDAQLYDRTVFVDYYYQATLDDLRAKYIFSLQPCNWDNNPYNRIYLFKPLVKNLDYSNLDEQTHAKIDAFMANHIGLFHPSPSNDPGNYAGFRFEDCLGTTNIRKINIIAVNYFEYSGKQPKPAEKIVSEIKKFEDMVKSLSDDLNQIISGNKTIELGVKSLIKKPVKKPRTGRCKVEGLVNDPSDTNQADQLMAKQAAFNALFTPAKGYTHDYWFDMTYGGYQFDVIYNWNAKEYVATMPVVFFTYFNVTKPLQECARQFCENQGPKVVPAGAIMTLIQNEVGYFQCMARFPWATNLSENQIQDNLGTFSSNYGAFSVI